MPCSTVRFVCSSTTYFSSYETTRNGNVAACAMRDLRPSFQARDGSRLAGTTWKYVPFRESPWPNPSNSMPRKWPRIGGCKDEVNGRLVKVRNLRGVKGLGVQVKSDSRRECEGRAGTRAPMRR